MSDKNNKARVLRKKIIIITVGTVPAMTFILASLYAVIKMIDTGSTAVYITAIVSITAVNISAAAAIYLYVLKLLKPLQNCTLFDSSDINRLIAKSTAPVKEKNYILHSNRIETGIKAALLRRELQKIYIILQKLKKGVSADV